MFDNPGDSLTVPEFDLLGESFTALFWIKRTGDSQIVLSHGTNEANKRLLISFRGDGRFTCGFGGNDLDAPDAVNDGQWHNYACSYDVGSGRQVLYRDGAQIAMRTVLTAYNGSGDLHIGAAATPWSSYTIDDLQIVRRALDGEAVRALFQAPSGGVAAGEIAFMPQLPGTPLRNELPLPGTLLHLTLDNQANAAGQLLLTDVSGYNNDATCTICPATSARGHSDSAVVFTGDQSMSVAPAAAAKLTNQSFTATFWVNLDSLDGDHSLLQLGTPQISSFMNLLIRDGLPVLSFYGNDTWMTEKIAANTWQHLTFRNDKATGEQTIFVNGVERTRQNGHAAFAGSGEALIGRGMRGRMDEVKIFDSALSTAAVQAIYRGSEPTLVLGFDERHAAKGATLTDSSGWQNNGVIESGAGDTANKLVPGKHDTTALWLDGTDDMVTLPATAALGLTGGDFTVAAWINASALNYSSAESGAAT